MFGFLFLNRVGFIFFSQEAIEITRAPKSKIIPHFVIPANSNSEQSDYGLGFFQWKTKTDY
jgi:hypothetical protein